MKNNKLKNYEKIDFLVVFNLEEIRPCWMNVYSKSQLLAIAALCPKLQQVWFGVKLMVPDLMPHEVRNVLSQKLSKVNFKRFTLRSSFLISSSIRQQVVQLRFNRVPALYREAIWYSINELQLRSLWFYQCKNIDVMRLSTCFQLEVLELTLGCTIPPTSQPATLKPDQFLSLLEILHIFGTCLGKWGPFTAI